VHKLLAEVFCVTESKLLFLAVDAITIRKIETFEHFTEEITAKITDQLFCLHQAKLSGRGIMFFGFRSFIHPSVCYQTCERDIMKTNKLILMPIGKSSPRVIDMKRSTLGVKRSKVKVTQG